MNTKTCKKCGWEWDIDEPGIRCKICGEYFDIVKCRTCGKIVSGDEKVPKRDQCKACHNAEEREHMARYTERVRIETDERFDSWMGRIRIVPSNYPPITEAQWLEACKYFNGCARCGGADVTTRGFFIGRDIGGKYCDWNVIPLCEKCAHDWPLNSNIFYLAMRRDRRKKTGHQFRDCVEKIVKYLEPKLNAAVLYKKEDSDERK